MFLEPYARTMLLGHAVLGAALVGASTHLVLWMRRFPRGEFHRLAAVRKFSVITLCLFALEFVLGNLLYPTYKVRVRAEYLDEPAAVMDDVENRALARARVAERHEARSPPPSVDDDVRETDGTSGVSHAPRRAAKIARWFDVKEHWVALGLALAAACTALLLAWNPKRHGDAIAPIVFLMAVAVAATAWIGAIIGVVVSSYRAVGGPG